MGWGGGAIFCFKSSDPQIGGPRFFLAALVATAGFADFFCGFSTKYRADPLPVGPVPARVEIWGSQNGVLGSFLVLLVSKIGFSESNCVRQTQRELLKSLLDPSRELLRASVGPAPEGHI